MSQQVITSYFGKRKRIAEDYSKVKAKKILLEDVNASSDLKCGVSRAVEENDNCAYYESFKCGKTNSSLESKTNEDKYSECTENGLARDTGRAETNCQYEQKIFKTLPPVSFKLMGSLSPTKKSNSIGQGAIKSDTKEQPNIITQSSSTSKHLFQDKSKDKCTTDSIIKTAQNLVKQIKQKQKVSKKEQHKARKELSLKEVKDKLKQSAKLNELRKSINKINEQAAVLIELENKKKENSVPKLSKFKAIEVDVPLSPQKNALYSPSKIERSPGKFAYERYNFLAEDNTTLQLPFSFQKLFELFQAVDTISSMMINRGEDITFSKLKPAVQEMTRKTFTLRHLGQIAAVLPHAFNFRQEKVRNFGSTSKIDKYELVIKPTFPDAQGRPQAGGERSDIFHISDRMSMTPKVIKARREAFYEALLNKTKDCHEEFLQSLDPPMHINRNDLKRWHPNFMVDHVPDIVPRELPQPPNSERPATAKEVLERAKDFLSSNARLQKALESASQSSSDELRDITSRISPAVKEKVDSKISNPLKGIPKSLLEKVRARQAAKALDSMRMTPQQEKETVMYTRLPAIARIVRTLFVNEQRGVLSWETVVEKVRFSYNRNLGKGEVESHVKLLVELLHEWLSVVHIRNTNYLKMNPAADLTSVMSKLDKIVSEKAKNT